ncbi:hypothetical protein [Maribacter sp.]|uniref:hypothetical protein n=1 Tax=Maribacter sp. TaxID=1897614 RepID=UPI0025C21830|nr:hypothetical protein [Maribacter sp.]
MKNLFFTLFFISTSITVYSQKFRAGLVMPTKEFKLCCVYIPDSGLVIYNQPNGNPQGEICLGKPNGSNEFYTASIKKQNSKQILVQENFEMVGYEVMALIVIDSKSGYVKLKNGYWISIEELKSKNLKLTSWMDYAIEKNTEWYANKPGLNLRTGPSIAYNKIVTLKGDLFGINLTTERKGKWCKVNVTQYRKHPCSGEDNLIIKTYSGWVKLISEEETLNVWHYGKGC